MKKDLTLRNAEANLLETHVGASPTLSIFTGAAPANTTDADSGTLIVTINLPADWLADAANGAKALTGTWPATPAVGACVHADFPGHFRLKTSGGTVILQGQIMQREINGLKPW